MKLRIIYNHWLIFIILTFEWFRYFFFSASFQIWILNISTVNWFELIEKNYQILIAHTNISSRCVCGFFFNFKCIYISLLIILPNCFFELENKKDIFLYMHVEYISLFVFYFSILEIKIALSVIQWNAFLRILAFAGDTNGLARVRMLKWIDDRSPKICGNKNKNK